MKLDLAICQFRPVKADVEASLAEAARVFERVEAMKPRPDMLVFPETALTGYFLEGGVREHAMTAEGMLERLNGLYLSGAARPAGAALEVVIGFFELYRDRVYNSGLCARLGEDPAVLHVHRKVFLPTYGVFQEERFVDPGHTVRAFDTSWGRAAMLICEDMFHSISSDARCPGRRAADPASAQRFAGARHRAPGLGRTGQPRDRWERIAARRSPKSTASSVAVGPASTGFEGEARDSPGGSIVCTAREASYAIARAAPVGRRASNRPMRLDLR